MKVVVGVDALRVGDGISTVVLGLARHLRAWGHNVGILCSRVEVSTDLPIVPFRFNAFLKQGDVLDAYRALRRSNPDIFHPHYYPLDIVGGLATGPRIRCVMHFHGVYYLALRRSAREMIAGVRSNIGEMYGAHRASKVIAVSSFAARELRRKYLVPSGKVITIPNGIDLTRFKPAQMGRAVRRAHGLDCHQPVLLCVASASPRKGLDLLLESVAQASRSRSDIILMLVGPDGPSGSVEVGRLAQRATRLGIRKNIRFCGVVDNEDLPKYYVASDIFVSATRWESFGLPFAEAMACGRPVLGFDCTAVSEMIVDGFNGFKVPLGNSVAMAERIVELCEDRALASRMGINGRSYAQEHFDMQRNMARIVEVYESVLAEPRP